MAHAKARNIHFWDADGVDISADFKNGQVTPEESEDSFTSHAAMRDGTNYDWTLSAEVAEDAGAGKPWQLMKDPTTRGSEFPFYYSAFVDSLGDVTADAPAYMATAIVTLPSGSKMLGDESSRSPKKVPTVEIEWPCIDEPVAVTVPPVFTP